MEAPCRQSGVPRIVQRILGSSHLAAQEKPDQHGRRFGRQARKLLAQLADRSRLGEQMTECRDARVEQM